MLPSLSSMWGKYPTGPSTSVKAKIGGNINLAWITNTCVIRISYCFNECGAPIPSNFGGMLTASGRDGKRYAIRVREFKAYLETRFKPADIKGTTKADVAGASGIIMFDVAGWSDATGHFDLWDGGECRGSEYFDKASGVYLWRC